MKFWHFVLVGMLLVTGLAGCGGETPAPTAEQESTAPANVNVGEKSGDTSSVPDTFYPNALPADSQLALGTLLLEETENAVTPEQAKTLLPLWQAIQGGTLQGESETNAALKQIEAKMTSEQLAAIAAMQLTVEDLETWTQEQGLSLGSPEVLGNREGDFGPPGDMSEEEREAMRATVEAGGMSLSGRGAGAGGDHS